MTVLRDEFATDDPELAEDMIRRIYVDQRLSISGRSADISLGHSSLAVAGRHGFAFNRLHHTLNMHLEADPLDDFLAADAPRRGVLEIGACPETTASRPVPARCCSSPRRVASTPSSSTMSTST